MRRFLTVREESLQKSERSRLDDRMVQNWRRIVNSFQINVDTDGNTDVFTDRCIRGLVCIQLLPCIFSQNDVSPPTSTPTAEILASNAGLQLKEPGLPGDVAHSQTGVGKVQDEPAAPVS